MAATDVSTLNRSSLDVTSIEPDASSHDELIPPPRAPLGRGRPSVPVLLRQIVRALTQAMFAILAIAVAIVVGVMSSRSMIANGSLFSIDSYGPWHHWRSAGRDSADPYTRAHMTKSGRLLLASDSAGVYEANTDTLGARLHSSCDYVIEGPDPGGMWWSMAVFDSAGALIANDAERYAFTSDTAAINPDGSYIVTLGRDARPGNWLPTGGAGRLSLVFTTLDPPTGLSDEERAARSKLLPVIRREGCS